MDLICWWSDSYLKISVCKINLTVAVITLLVHSALTWHKLETKGRDRAPSSFCQEYSCAGNKEPFEAWLLSSVSTGRAPDDPTQPVENLCPPPRRPHLIWYSWRSSVARRQADNLSSVCLPSSCDPSGLAWSTA